MHIESTGRVSKTSLLYKSYRRELSGWGPCPVKPPT